MHEGQFVIRFQVGQFDCQRDDVLLAIEVLREFALGLEGSELGDELDEE